MPLIQQPTIPGLPLPQLPPGLAPPAAAPTAVAPPIPPIATPGVPTGGLDAFLQQIANPTGSSQFLLDLGAKLLQPRAPGTGAAGAIAQAGSQAVGGLSERQAAAGQTAFQRQLGESRLATEKAQRGQIEAETAAKVRETESADLQDELTKAVTAQKKALAKKGTTGKIASKVQEAQNLGAVLFTNHGPDSANPKFANINEAVEAAYRFFTPVGKDPDAWYATAVASFQEQNSLVLNPDEMAAGVAAIGKVRDDWKAKGVQSVVEQKPAAPAAPAATASVDIGAPPEIKQLIDQQVQGVDITPEQVTTLSTWLIQQYPDLKERQAAYTKALGQDTTAATTKPVAKEEPVKPVKKGGKDTPKATRKEAKAARLRDIESRRAAAVEKIEATRQATSELKDEVRDMTKTEIISWLEKNREFLTPAQKRRVTALIRKKGK